MTLTFGSLFSGIGGIDLGLERAGMQIVWQCEIDDYCTKVLTKHWPDVPKYRDVRSVGAHNLATVDLIAGGFPCQPFSDAGERRGADDDRNLWPEFARIVCELRPRWVLAENVPGLLSIDFGRVFGGILRDLAALGYDAEWHCIPAAALGAPHRRDRVYIVAYSKGIRRTRQRATQTIQNRGALESARRGSGPRGEWAIEPAMGRVADGVPDRFYRLSGLGNAVVPRVAEFIGECIVALDKQPNSPR